MTERPVIRTRKRCLEDARLANAAFDAEVFGVFNQGDHGFDGGLGGGG